MIAYRRSAGSNPVGLWSQMDENMTLRSERYALDRRGFLRAAAAAALLGYLTDDRVWAGGIPSPMDAWGKRLLELNDGVKSASIAPAAWLEEVKKLNTSIELQQLAQYLDIDAAVSRFQYASRFPDFATLKLPDELMQGVADSAWTLRLVANRKGGVALPHVHNHWVESHMIISGAYRARTFDRLEDMDEAVILRPVRDALVKPGGFVEMSDERENCHWFDAEEDRSISLFISVMGVETAAAAIKNFRPHFFVDPTAEPRGDGALVAPVLTLSEARAKFAS